MKYILKTMNYTRSPVYYNEVTQKCTLKSEQATVYSTKNEATEKVDNFIQAIEKLDDDSKKMCDNIIILAIPDSGSSVSLISDMQALHDLFDSFGFTYGKAAHGQWHRQTKQGEVIFGITDSRTIYPYVRLRKGNYPEPTTFTTIEELEKFLTQHFSKLPSRKTGFNDPHNDVRIIKRMICKYAIEQHLDAAALTTLVNNILQDALSELGSTTDDDFNWNY